MLVHPQKRPASLRSVVGIVAVMGAVALAWIAETGSTADEPVAGEKKAETGVAAKEPKPGTIAVDPMTGTEAGQVREDNGLGMKLVWCPPGLFRMQPFFVRQTIETKDGDRRSMEEVVGVHKLRVIRGGCHFSIATDCRSTARGRSPSRVRKWEVGFRVALVPVRPVAASRTQPVDAAP